MYKNKYPARGFTPRLPVQWDVVKANLNHLASLFVAVEIYSIPSDFNIHISCTYHGRYIIVLTGVVFK